MAPTFTLLPPEDEDVGEDGDVCEAESGEVTAGGVLRELPVGEVVVVPEELINAPGPNSGVTRNRRLEMVKEITEKIPTAGIQRFDGVKITLKLASGINKYRKR